MDRSRRAAIGRALRAREQGSNPAFLSLTEDEQENGLALFAGEDAETPERPPTLERAAANAGTAVRPARKSRYARPPAMPEPGNVLVWQVPVLAALFTAVVAAFALTPATRPSDRPVERVEAAHDVVLPGEPMPAILSPAPSVDSSVPEGTSASDDVTQAVVRKTPRVRIAPPIQPASVSIAARPPEPRPAPESTIARIVDSPAAPASVPVEPPRPAVAAAVVPAALPRVESGAPPVRPPAPDAAIQGVLSRYRHAYDGLDAGAARAVWPNVDHKALSKAFDRLEQQQLVFDACAIAVTDARAVASCRGVASYVPRVGNKVRRDDQRQWEFTLSKVDDAWLIDSVLAR